MYLRWAQRHRFATEILDQLEGEEAGLKSVTVAIDGRYAYGNLRAERGVHRLVRISPYDSQKRRHTTFALVEVLPEVEDDTEVGDIPEDELRIETFRSQGAGGQHVNKTDSAVRLTHIPTGITAQSQNERSQHQNRESAMKILKARLLERAHRRARARSLLQLRGEHVEAGWGNQIRSYVLHPYQMVKDHRTNYETSATNDVLDGDLDAFMLAELERLATSAVAVVTDGFPTDHARRRPRPASRSSTTPTRRSRPVATCRSRRATRWRSSASSAHASESTPERCWLAEQDGKVVGFGMAVDRDDLTFPAFLFVLPDAQAAGLGAALLREVHAAHRLPGDLHLVDPAHLRRALLTQRPRAARAHVHAHRPATHSAASVARWTRFDRHRTRRD